jgi:hypothetical protein
VDSSCWFVDVHCRWFQFSSDEPMLTEISTVTGANNLIVLGLRWWYCIWMVGQWYWICIFLLRCTCQSGSVLVGKPNNLEMSIGKKRFIIWHITIVYIYMSGIYIYISGICVHELQRNCLKFKTDFHRKKT